MLLALDTSTRRSGVALYEGARGVVAEYNWISANRHTEELLPIVAQVMAQAGLSPRDLTAVGVAVGPGSFTGLRVGVAAAKGLALAHGLSLVGVSTLDFTAYPHQAQPVPVIALVQAGRGRFYWAPYAHGPAGWSAQEPAGLATSEALACKVVRATMFVGEVTPEAQETLTRFLGRARAHFLPPALAMRRAGYLAELAWQRLQAGQTDNPASLSPIYLQQPDGTLPAGDA